MVGGTDRNARLIQSLGGWIIAVSTVAGPGALVSLFLWLSRADGVTSADSAAASALVIALPVVAQTGLIGIAVVLGVLFLAVRDEFSPGNTTGSVAGAAAVAILCIASAVLPGLAGPWTNGDSGVLEQEDSYLVLGPAVLLALASAGVLMLVHCMVVPEQGRWRVAGVDALVPLGAAVTLCLAAESLNAGWTPLRPGTGPEIALDAEVGASVTSDGIRPFVVLLPVAVGTAIALFHDLVLAGFVMLVQGSCLREDPTALARGDVN